MRGSNAMVKTDRRLLAKRILLVSALFKREMDNICNGYSRPNDSSVHGLGNLAERRQGNLQTMRRKKWFRFAIHEKEKNEGRDGRMTKESTSKTETKLFAKPFARSSTRRSFIVSLFSSKYIPFRETRSLARLSISLPRKLRCRNAAMTSGTKRNLCICDRWK